MTEQFSLGRCNLEDDEGLFRATVLWKDIINHLEGSIKCGRHTQTLRSFTNCFYGSKVVNCLVLHLNAILPKVIKRPQIQTLCQKLVLTGVIADVKNKNKHIFGEGRLYRLTRNHFWTERKLPRTRSCNEIFTEKESDTNNRKEDLKGYSSDSTIVRQVESKSRTQKKKKRCFPKQTYPDAYKSRLSSRYFETKVTPDSSKKMRRKSTSSISKTSENGLPQLGSRDSLYSDVKHKRKIPKGVVSRRRGSVGSGMPHVKPPTVHIKRSRIKNSSTESGPRKQYGREKGNSCQLSHSFKGNRDRGDTFKEDATKKLHKSHSLSSVSDYAAWTDISCNEKTPSTSKLSTMTSGNKWIIYGFL